MTTQTWCNGSLAPTLPEYFIKDPLRATQWDNRSAECPYCHRFITTYLSGSGHIQIDQHGYVPKPLPTLSDSPWIYNEE